MIWPHCREKQTVSTEWQPNRHWIPLRTCMKRNWSLIQERTASIWPKIWSRPQEMWFVRFMRNINWQVRLISRSSQMWRKSWITAKWQITMQSSQRWSFHPAIWMNWNPGKKRFFSWLQFTRSWQWVRSTFTRKQRLKWNAREKSSKQKEKLCCRMDGNSLKTASRIRTAWQS